MRLLFVCRAFADGVGGVERISILVMNAMIARGHDVRLFTWDNASARAFYPMHDAIHWHRLDMGDPMRPASAALRMARLRRFRAWTLSSKPDVVVAFQHGPFLFAAAGNAGTGIPLILSERNAPDSLDHLRAGRHRGAMFQTMRIAAAITVQFPAYVERYPRYLRRRIAVVPNPVQPAAGRATPGAPRERRTLLAVGRLSYQKHFSVLLHAFARLAPTHPEWRLRIVGEGEQRTELEELARELGLQERIALDRPTTDIHAVYGDADLFCLPSRWEGFPNALAEAMSHGLPAVGFQECAGVNELIVPGRTGELAEGNGDVAALARALSALMQDDQRRARLGDEARKITEQYRPERVMDIWEQLFRRTARTP